MLARWQGTETRTFTTILKPGEPATKHQDAAPPQVAVGAPAKAEDAEKRQKDLQEFMKKFDKE